MQDAYTPWAKSKQNARVNKNLPTFVSYLVLKSEHTLSKYISKSGNKRFEVISKCSKSQQQKRIKITNGEMMK